MMRLKKSIVVLLVLFTGLSFRYPNDCGDEIPSLNRQILDLTEKQMGKKVGRGECWDLAALVLNETGASWDGQLRFGRAINPETECVFPGDIIQFEKVKTSYKEGASTYVELMYHHTAIVYEVPEQGTYVLAQQNTESTGKRVGLGTFRPATVVKGHFTIYRPVPGH